MKNRLNILNKFIKTIDEDLVKIELKEKGKILISQTTLEYEGLFDDMGEKAFNNLKIDENEFISKIEYIEVNENFANKGIGTQLMNQAILEIKKQGFNYAYLNACPMGGHLVSKDILVKFYSKFGFKEVLDQGGNSLMICETKKLKIIN